MFIVVRQHRQQVDCNAEKQNQTDGNVIWSSIRDRRQKGRERGKTSARQSAGGSFLPPFLRPVTQANGRDQSTLLYRKNNNNEQLM